MFGLFGKMSDDEKGCVEKFERIISRIPDIKRYSYRKKWVYEIIFDSNYSLDSSHDNAEFLVLGDVWMKISSQYSYNSALHIGVIDRPGYRVELDNVKIMIGPHISDHKQKVQNYLSMVNT